MIRISIVEDNPDDCQKLQALLDRFQKEKGGPLFDIKSFSSALPFLSNYQPVDIVFMDIELPNENGMEASHQLRKIDKDVMIIFVTNMEQFAVAGYQVNAFDFIVKPLTYYDFSLKLGRALETLQNSSIRKSLMIKIPGKILKVNLSDLKYVEINDYVLTYHTISGTYEVTSTRLQDIQPLLNECDFFQISRDCIINLKFITSINDKEIIMEGITLPISRRRKTAFLDAFMSYMGKSTQRK